MSAPRREYPQQYIHPRNVNAYWREAVEREMAKFEELHPGIFGQPEQRQGINR